METKKLRRFSLIAFLITSAAGSLLHFVYEWTGESPIAAVFSAVNESTWEHMKLLFVPMLLLVLIDGVLFARRYPGYWAVSAASVVLGLLLIPTLYYTYGGILGTTYTAADIAIFFIAALVAWVFFCRMLKTNRLSSGSLQVAGIAVLAALTILFVVFTFYPPALGLFEDPISGSYGVPLLVPTFTLI